MKNFLYICVLATALSCATATAPPAATAVADREAVESVIRSFESTWNRHDMTSFANLFAEDADFVNVMGARWVGRTAIQEAHAASHASFFRNSQLTFGDTSIRFIKPDVAVARSHWRLTGHTTPTGEPATPRQGILTNVLVRSRGDWHIVVSQNTDVVVPGT